MDHLEVHTPKELGAAIAGMACATEADAAKAPFQVTFETTIYTFRAGVTEARAKQIAKNIRAVYYQRKRRARA